MKLFDRAKLAYNVFTQKALNNSLGAVIRNINGESTFNPQQQLKGITFKAIDKIGISVSVYKPIVNQKNGDAYVQHPILNLFNKPNPQTNPSDFIHLWAMFYEIYGETFWYLVRGESSRKIKEIYLLNPAQMEVKVYNGELIGYVLHKSSGEQVPFEIDEIIHDKRPNPFNEWRGMSVLEKASVYVDTEIITSQFTLSYMQNSGSPSGIVTLPGIDKEQFKLFCAQWRENYDGPKNAGKTAFVNGQGTDFKAVGATLKDVDQKVTRDMAKEDVLMMLEVPKPLLGITDDAGFGRGNIESLHYIFSKEKLEPMMQRLDNIYEQIAYLGGFADGMKEITHISPIPEDKEYKLSYNKVAVNVWKTVNEARAEDGLEPLPEGDVIKLDNKVAQTKRISLKTAEKVEKTYTVKEQRKKNEDFRIKLVETNEIYSKQVQAEISKFAKKQEDKIIANIDLSKKSFEEWLYNVKEQSVELAAILTQIIIELMEAQSEDVANFITGELLTITPEVRKTVEVEILKISGLYNEDTLKALEATLSEGQANGESLAKLKKRVEQTYQDAKGYRAERIARTESLKASNATAEMVYKQNGYSTVKWFTNPGACDFCRTFEGRTKTIGSNFVNIGDVLTAVDDDGKAVQMKIDYSDIQTPPLHPNCTCSIVPED